MTNVWQAYRAQQSRPSETRLRARSRSERHISRFQPSAEVLETRLVLSMNSGLTSRLLPVAIHSVRVKAHASAAIRFDVPPRALTRSVTGTSAILRTSAAGDGDQGSLTYTWAATSVPGGAPEPIFASNGTGAAGTTTVMFGMAGSYKFAVTAGDASGRKATRALNVKVQATLSRITVYPPETDLAQGDSEPLGATAFDQFGRQIRLQRHIRWTATAGVVSKTGMYKAPRSDETVVVTAGEGQIHGNAYVQIVTPGAPIITIPARVFRQYVGTAILSACGSEDGSTAGLTYDWTLTSGPAGSETPTIVDYSSDASSVAVIPRRPGTYAYTVTVTNASGLTPAVRSMSPSTRCTPRSSSTRVTPGRCTRGRPGSTGRSRRTSLAS